MSHFYCMQELLGAGPDGVYEVVSRLRGLALANPTPQPLVGPDENRGGSCTSHGENMSMALQRLTCIPAENNREQKDRRFAFVFNLDTSEKYIFIIGLMFISIMGRTILICA
jgi:hypothetical protein